MKGARTRSHRVNALSQSISYEAVLGRRRNSPIRKPKLNETHNHVVEIRKGRMVCAQSRVPLHCFSRTQLASIAALLVMYLCEARDSI